MVKIKRVNLIAELLSLLDGYKIKWIHFGGGELLNKVMMRANSLLLNTSINFEFKGAVTNDTILQFYAETHIDLFINVSSSEGIPVSIMEAMSFSIPVVATNVGGTSEIVNSSNGLMLNVDFSLKEAAQEIIKILSLGKEEKQSIRENAYNTWKLNYNADLNYPNFIKEINNLTNAVTS